VAKKYTVILIPEGTHQVKKFRTSLMFIPILILMVVASASAAGFWFYKFNQIQQSMPDVDSIERRASRQEAQIHAFDERLKEMKGTMTELKKFNKRLRILANLESPEDVDGVMGMGGPEASGADSGLRLTHTTSERKLRSMTGDLSRLEAESQAELLVQKELAKFLKERRSILACTPSVWPVRGWVTSGFGKRVSPFTGKKQFHSGIDISTRRGTPIIAPADGVVTFVGRDGSYGKLVAINHGHGIVTRYAHLHKYEVKKGQKIKRGDTIAQVGNTGRSTGPHLHYEVLLSGVPTNPKYYILD